MNDNTTISSIDRVAIPVIHNEKKHVTIKQKRWLQYYLKTGDSVKSARKAYKCSKESAYTIANDNLSKLEYPQFLEGIGITDVKLATKLNEGLEAHKIVTSHTEPDRIIPDMPTRHKYLETALKLKKRLVERDVIVVSDKTLIMDAVDVSEPLQGSTEAQKENDL